MIDCDQVLHLNRYGVCNHATYSMMMNDVRHYKAITFDKKAEALDSAALVLLGHFHNSHTHVLICF